jgi:hypothetical protein
MPHSQVAVFSEQSSPGRSQRPGNDGTAALPSATACNRTKSLCQRTLRPRRWRTVRMTRKHSTVRLVLSRAAVTRRRTAFITTAGPSASPPPPRSRSQGELRPTEPSFVSVRVPLRRRGTPALSWTWPLSSGAIHAGCRLNGYPHLNNTLESQCQSSISVVQPRCGPGRVQPSLEMAF